MKTLALTSALYLFSSFMPTTKSDTIYYCDSPNAARYHYTKDCSGLQKCTHAIRETTVNGASQKGLTACKLEK